MIKDPTDFRRRFQEWKIRNQDPDYIPYYVGGKSSNQQGSNDYINIAKDFVKRNESWSATPYADGPKGTGWRSVGWGFNDSGFRAKYPNGVSRYYEHGITKEQAEKELDWVFGNIISYLKNTYGNSWDKLNDNQKAAMIDVAYQNPSYLSKTSNFYRHFMGGDPNAVNYLGVTGYDSRNTKRRNLYGGIVQQEPMILQPRKSNLDIIKENVKPSFELLQPLSSPEKPIINLPASQQRPIGNKPVTSVVLPNVDVVEEKPLRERRFLKQNTRWGPLPDPIEYFNQLFGESIPNRQLLIKPYGQSSKIAIEA